MIDLASARIIPCMLTVKVVSKLTAETMFFIQLVERNSGFRSAWTTSPPVENNEWKKYCIHCTVYTVEHADVDVSITNANKWSILSL